MNTTSIIVLIIVAAACAVLIFLMYYFGKKNMERRDEQQKTIDETAQWVNMLIIDKKKMKLKDSGVPAYVIENTPKIARRAKAPIVKAKIGAKVVILIADNEVYDMIPVKKEVKGKLSGLFLSDVKGIRGPLEKPVKKRGLWAKLTGQK